MNILLLTREMYPYKIGGREIFLYYLANDFAKRKHNVKVIFQNDKCIDQNDEHLIGITPVGIPGLRTISFFAKTIFATRKMSNPVDVINGHFHDFNCLFLPLLRWLFKTNYIVTVHGGGLKPLRPKWAYNFVFRKASAVVAVSEKIKRAYSLRGCHRVVAIPAMLPVEAESVGKDDQRAELGLGNGVKVILFVGRLAANKNPGVLLDTLRLLGQEYICEHRLHLVFIGDGSLREKLSQDVVNCGLSHCVRIVGSLPHEQIGSWLRISDLFVLPSDYEGFPLSVVEAMSYGVTVIGTNVRGINELIDHRRTGLLYEKGNTLELAALVRDMIENNEHRKSIGEKAKKFIDEHYSFRATVDKYLDLYEQAKCGKAGKFSLG